MDVIVIGSGPAGLAAMRKLLEVGLKAVCLEAADRIGGRVNTVPFADNVVDLGAMVCEGDKGNVVAEMAKPYNILEPPKEQEKYYLLSNGQAVSDKTVEEFSEKIDSIISNGDKKNIKSIAGFVHEKVDSDPIIKEVPALNKSLLEWYGRLHEFGGESDPKLGKSMRGVQERFFCEGPWKMWKGKGMGMILDVLMNKYPDPSKEIKMDIQMKKEVDHIRWKNANNLVEVECKDGSTFSAKSVISTVSVGVLKERHSYFFKPPLPEAKIDVINNLQMFVLDKIFMEFERPWWPKADINFNLIWRDEDKEKFSAEDKWITEVYSIESVEFQQNVLLGWINDEGARLMEKTSEDDVRKGMDKLLELLFKEKFPVTPIKTLLRTKWATNRFERGAYSYRSVYTEENGSSADKLAEPLCNESGFPVICFAGEATSRHLHSTVHGAIETGCREAERLIKLMT